MSVTLNADRIYTILVIIVAVMDSVLKWLTKRRKKHVSIHTPVFGKIVMMSIAIIIARIPNLPEPDKGASS